MEKRYQVFISSTYSDLKEERAKVMQVIMNLNCIPAGMELFPAVDDEQFEYIMRVINDCDYYILIVGGRYGSLSEDGISYTEKEFEYAKSIGLPILAFLHSDLDSIPLGKSEIEPNKRQSLNQFREKVSTGRLVKFWDKSDDLPGLVAVSLSQTIMQSPAVGWIRANVATSTESIQKENDLRKQLADAKERIAQLEKEKGTNKTVDNIATLDETVTIRFKHVYWSHQLRQDVKENSSVDVTWGGLFEKIAPRLMHHPTEENAKEIVDDILAELYNGSSNGRIIVNHEDFDTIKIQCMALDLIEVSYNKTIKGGMALFWRLTPKGQELMIQRRVVRSKSVDQGDN